MTFQALFRFSWKNLWAHRMRAILTVGGVSIGVSAIVFLVSLGFGLERLVTSQVANFQAFTLIDVPSAASPTGKVNQETIDKIQSFGHIALVERVIDLAGRARLQDQDSTTETVVVGVTPTYFDLVDTTLSGGSYFSDQVVNDGVINQALAGLLGFSDNPTDALQKEISIDIIIPKSARAADLTEGAIVKERIPITVVGVTADSQNPVLYLPQKLTDQQGVVNSSSMKIQVDDQEAVPGIRKQIENLGFATEYIGDTVDQITQVFGVFRIVLGSFGVIALLVAALGTFNTLTISLIERIREVALLKMMGMKNADVFRLFISESLTIGVFGGVSGAISGYSIGFFANMIISRLASKAGGDAVTIFYTPWSFIVLIALGSIIVGVLTGLYPSYRAIKTNPLDALRYE